MLGLGKTALLAGAVVEQPIHPFAGIAAVVDRRTMARVFSANPNKA